jgi:DNA polymerase I-like protein with 3'-5' exonuclease and polymerase domains
LLFRGTLDQDGAHYTVYRLVTKNIVRIDIMEDGSEFQVDANRMLFGFFKRKSMAYNFGDVVLDRNFQAFKNSVIQAKGESKTETKWVNSDIQMVTRKEVSPDCFSEEVLLNGKEHEKTYHLQDSHYYEVCVSRDFEIEMEPANFIQYEKIQITKEPILQQAKTPIVPLDRLRQRININKWANNPDIKYEIITNPERAREHIAFLKTMVHSPEVTFGFDWETTGTTFNCYEADKIVGLVVNYKYNQSVYLPFGHEGVDWNLPWEILDEILDVLQEGRNCAHLKKFEKKVLMSIGRRYFPVQDDSMIASIIRNPIIQKGAHGLKFLGNRVTGWNFIELEDIFENKSQIDFSKITDPELARVYACPDADSSVKVLNDELKKLPKETHGIYTMECELADLKAEQEYWGFRVNYNKIVEDAKNCNDILDNLKRIFHEMTRTDVDLNSPQALSDLLYSKLNCPVLVRTKTHQPSTGAKARKKLAREKRAEPLDTIKQNITGSNGDVLIKAADLNAAKYPPILVLNAYRDYAKLTSAFYSRFLNAKFKDRYFSWINQHGADTGRQSSPMHQLPKKIKECILADSEDHVLVDADYSQVELRILASAAKERDLVAQMRDPGKDIHRIIANKISGVPMYLISSAMRQGFKMTNFGVVYLISARGLAEQRFGVGCGKDKIQICEDSILDFYKTFKRIKIFNERSKRQVLEKGVAYTFFNRARFFPEIMQEGLFTEKRESYIRQATNMPIQGTAADVMKMAENNLNRYIRAKGWDQLVDTPQGKFPLARVMLSAHDEVLCSVHKSLVRNVPEIYKMIRECMEIQIEDWAPLYTSTCIIDNWREGKDDKFAVPIELRDQIIEEGTLRLGDDPKKDMLAILQEYREKEVVQYVTGLIDEVGSKDPKVLAKYVTDDVLTHSLIDRFGPSWAWIAKNGELDQEGTILYSITAAVEELFGDKKVEEPAEEVKQQQKVTDLSETIIEIMELSEEIFDFDSDGNLIGVEGEDLADAEDYEVFDDSEKNVHFEDGGYDKNLIVFETLNMAIVDTEGLPRTELQALINLLYTMKDDEGLGEFYLYHNGSMLPTTIKYEHFDSGKITEWVSSRRQVKVNV